MTIDEIVLLILGIVLFIYLVLCWGILFYLLHLKKIIKRKETVINSLIAQQYDLTQCLGEMLLEEGIDVPELILDSLDIHQKKEMKSISTNEKSSVKFHITNSMNNLIIIADQSSLYDQKRYTVLKSSLMEFSKTYRQETIAFNQLIYGYNYWINFLPFKLFSFMFGIKNKEYIN